MKEDIVSDSIFEAICAYFDNTITQSQAEELISWLGDSEDNIRYFKDAGRIWYASGFLKGCKNDPETAGQKLLIRIKEEGSRHAPRKRIAVPLRLLYLSAAAVALLISLGVLSGLLVHRSGISKTEGFYLAEAPKGSRSVLTLSDGSKVWLNSGTKLSYKTNFGVVSRDLDLEGEAYFVVAENRKIPFRVRAGDINITARGTAFNVKAYLEENVVETTLEKGEVVLEHVRDSRSGGGSEVVILKPNQRAVFTKSSHSLAVDEIKSGKETGPLATETKAKINLIKVDNLADTKISTSWKDSKWIFRSEKLCNLAPILERRYDIKIIFRDSVLRDYKFSGTLKEESLEQVLKAMTYAAPLSYEVSHNTVYLSSDRTQLYRFFNHPD